MTRTIEQLKILNPDVVFGCAYSSELQQHAINEMQRIDWLPKILSFTPVTVSYWESVVRQ